jgi:hypothetical protein
MINWLKRNWALAILIIIAITWAKTYLTGYSSYQSGSGPSYSGGVAMDSVASVKNLAMPSINREVAPTDSTSRLVIQDTNLSLQVKDVAAEIKSIESLTKQLGGYMVNSHLSQPESAASGNITIRIPEDKRPEALEGFKKLAVKVVSVSVYGNDVTDEYVDLGSRLLVLTKTKAKFEDIMDKAYVINDLLNVQRELISLQSQIDSLKGQQKYYEQSAKLSKVTIYLSTDELALPYAPTNEWRPAVVFKEAVRSLIGNLRNIGSLIIWLAVYSPIIIPVCLFLWYIRKRSWLHT